METNKWEFKATSTKFDGGKKIEIQINESGTRARYRITTRFVTHSEVTFGRWQHIRQSRHFGSYISYGRGYRLYLHHVHKINHI